MVAERTFYLCRVGRLPLSSCDSHGCSHRASKNLWRKGDQQPSQCVAALVLLPTSGEPCRSTVPPLRAPVYVINAEKCAWAEGEGNVVNLPAPPYNSVLQCPTVLLPFSHVCRRGQPELRTGA